MIKYDIFGVLLLNIYSQVFSSTLKVNNYSFILSSFKDNKTSSCFVPSFCVLFFVSYSLFNRFLDKTKRMGDDTIEKEFKKVDDAIANKQDDVFAMLSQLKSTIDEMESENEEKFNLYRYRWHSTRAAYSKALGKLDEYQKEEKMMQKYLGNCQKKEQRSTPNQESQDVQETPMTAEESAIEIDRFTVDAIEESLNGLEKLVDKNNGESFAKLKSSIQAFIEDTVNSFDVLSKSDATYRELKGICDILINQTVSNPKATEDQDTLAAVKNITNLRDRLTDLLYQRKVNFVDFVLSRRFQLCSILFANIPLTEERIRAHMKRLCVLFHPDKCQKENRSRFTEICQLITEHSRKQLAELSKHADHFSLIEHHKRQGKKHWDIAVEYKNVRQQKWDKVKRIKKEELGNVKDTELVFRQSYHAVNAYEQYRAAARELDFMDSNNLEISKKVELKKYMALALYLTGKDKIVEAQIYVIAGMFLVLRSGNASLYKKELEDLRTLMEKIQNIEKSSATISGNNVEKKEKSEIVNTVESNSSLVPFGTFEANIFSALRTAILEKCMLRPENRNVAIPEQAILAVREKAAEYTLKSVLSVAAGATVGGSLVVNAIWTTYEGATIGTMILGPIGTLLGAGIGLSTVVAGILLGHFFYKKGSSYREEPKIRLKLNKIMEDAVQHYHKADYSAVLRALADRYDLEKALIDIKETEVDKILKVSLEIQPKNIVKELLNHGFLPEGVAYVLVLLGEVLLLAPALKESAPNEMALELPSMSEFNGHASKVFEEVWINEDLKKQAQNIDKQVRSMISTAQSSSKKLFLSVKLAYQYSASRN